MMGWCHVIHDGLVSHVDDGLVSCVDDGLVSCVVMGWYHGWCHV